jgi:hypothetical protein
MKNTNLTEKRVYATPGRKVAVRGQVGRPKAGKLVANLYSKANIYARIVEVKGERILVGRNQVKVML